MTSEFVLKQLDQLKQHINDQLYLLNEYERNDIFESDPKTKMRWHYEIERCKSDLEKYKTEFEQIESQLPEEERLRLQSLLSDGQSRLNDLKSKIPPIWMVPSIQNPNFTGRDKLLSDLHDSFKTNVVQVLTGMDGVGKTQTALEYSYRHRRDYSIVWWLRSENPTILSADYADLIDKLGLPVESDRIKIITSVRSWLERNSGWLLVFDNTIDEDKLKDFIPRSDTGHVLVTSSNPNWSKVMEVKRFERQDSVKFISNRTGQDDHKAADKLAHEMGDLPLALEHACAYIQSTRSPLVKYVELYRTNPKKLISKQIAGKKGEDILYTWQISADKLNKTSPPAIDLLRLCSFLAPDKIPLDLLAKGADELPEDLKNMISDPMDRNDLVAALRSYSLVDAWGDQISVHRLVQTAIRYWQSEDGKNWAETAVKAVNTAFPSSSDDLDSDSHYESMLQESALLLPHALTALDHAMKCKAAPKIVAGLQNQVALYLMSQFDFVSAKSKLESALEIKKKEYGSNHPEVAKTLTNLGIVLQNLGDDNGALEHLEQALSINERVYGPDHIEVAKTVGNLGNVFYRKGNYEAAQEQLNQAKDIFDKYDPDSPWAAKTLVNLGLVMREFNNYRSALDYLGHALKIFEDKYGPNSPKVAMTLADLGAVLREMGDYQTSREDLERALKIYEDKYGPNHLQIAMILVNLGIVLRLLGEYQQAKENMERALRINEAVYGPDHREVAMTLTHLGNVLRSLNEYDTALQYQEKALDILKKAYSDPHPDMAIVCTHLGILLRDSNDKTDNLYAKDYLDRAYIINERVYNDPDHPKVAVSLGHLGIICLKLYYIDDAWTCLKRSADILEKCSYIHPDKAVILTNLALVFISKGFFQSAKEYLEQVIELEKRYPCSNHPAMGDIQSLLNQVQDRLETCGKDKTFFENELKALADNPRPDRSEVASALVSLASAERGLGDYQNSLDHFNRALNILNDTFGPNHPYTIEVEYNRDAISTFLPPSKDPVSIDNA